MRKFYHRYVDTYHNDTFIRSHHTTVISENPQNRVIEITWDNVEEYQRFCNSYRIWYLKKGRNISFFVDDFWPRGDKGDMREWNHPDLNITVRVEYEEYEPSFDELSRCLSAKELAEYLNERGISFKR